MRRVPISLSILQPQPFQQGYVRNKPPLTG